uniref:LisH domain-containing protein n=1 Tax=Caenorhabditis tropicalis TaxID=1561998 RepID=A0A1I7UUH6_9PELO
MFQQRGAGGGPPPQGMPIQQPMMPLETPYEVTAKDRLTTYVYEYLLQTGATKTAEAFKEEVISTNPNLPNALKPSEKTFLLDWWVLFWDLWSAAPERRETNEMYPTHSAEAKYFHDTLVGLPPGMNGHFGPPMGMDMMGGHPGAFPGRGFPPGRMPAGMPPGGFPGMFNPGMQRMPAPGMRMGPPGAQFAGGMPRPGVPGAPMGEMPGMRYDFMGPAGAQPFPGPSSSGMMPNGGMPHMSLNSPNMGPPPGADPNMPGPFMGMAQMPPTSSSTMPFGMSDQPLSAGPAGGAPGPDTPGIGGSVPGAEPGSVPPAATTSVGSVGTPTSVGQPQLKQEPTSNGEEIKSEALTPTGAGGGSVGGPGSAPMATVSMNGTGPGSAPGSAHSVNNNVNPSTPSGGPMSNPLSNPMSNPPLSSGPAPGSAEAFKDDSEISKIREGLLDGFKTEVASGPAWD